jgi:hypothetical protein
MGFSGNERSMCKITSDLIPVHCTILSLSVPAANRKKAPGNRAPSAGCDSLLRCVRLSHIHALAKHMRALFKIHATCTPLEEYIFQACAFAFASAPTDLFSGRKTQRANFLCAGCSTCWQRLNGPLHKYIASPRRMQQEPMRKCCRRTRIATREF